LALAINPNLRISHDFAFIVGPIPQWIDNFRPPAWAVDADVGHFPL
jgi:hypothetical protein